MTGPEISSNQLGLRCAQIATTVLLVDGAARSTARNVRLRVFLVDSNYYCSGAR